MPSGSLVSINVSSGGVPKLPVGECRITKLGLEEGVVRTGDAVNVAASEE